MSGLETLRKKYPWPSRRPHENLSEWSIDAGGKKLVVDVIRERGAPLVVELGAFLGGSARIWLEANPNLVLICVDPWEGGWWAEYARRHGRKRLAAVFLQPDGPFDAFISLMWVFRDRLIPVRGRSLEVLEELRELEIEPDLFFLDNDKSGQELEVCERLFPRAVLSGDDWTWGKDGVYPIQKAVREFCRQHRYSVQAKDCTWVLHRGPISLTLRATLILSELTASLQEVRRKILNRLPFLRALKRKLVGLLS